MSKISFIKARQILDSRGTPTVEVDVWTEDGGFGRASVPSGASTGINESLELRDGNTGYYFGKSVIKAVKNINEVIAPQLIGKEVTKQKEIDDIMLKLDGTENKSNLGANAILGVSLAVCRAGASDKKMSLYEYLSPKSNTLPLPMMNIINGGKHAGNNLNIQEFMIVPVGAKTWSQALQMCAEVFEKLKSLLKGVGFSTAVGDEGGFAPNFNSDEEALKFIVKAIQLAHYRENLDFKIALDVAASEMYNEADKIGLTGNYFFWKTKKTYSPKELMKFYENLIKHYPIISIEDPFGENDWASWKEFNKKFGDTIQIVGDDLFVTNENLLARGIKEKSANAILIKPNQIGTLTETLRTIKLAQENGFRTIISHRSGETEDTFIADLAVAVSAKQIKTGAPSRTERVAKYNQLSRIEEYLGENARFRGGKIFDNTQN